MRSWILKKWSEGIGARYLLLLLLFSGCTGSRLSVQTDFLTDENLASYYVNTPDPLLNCGAVGQRMLISWAFPKAYLQCYNMYILVHIRYRNHEEELLRLENLNSRDLYIFTLLNDDYFKTKGILTYKAELFADDVVLVEWYHQLWVELITLDVKD